MNVWEPLGLSWSEFVEWSSLAAFLVNMGLWSLCLPWVLMTRTQVTTALVWCLVILLLPIVGALLFVFFGGHSLRRALGRKRRHGETYRHGEDGAEPRRSASERNHVVLYHEGPTCLDTMVDTVRAAQHHVHLQTPILPSGESGNALMQALTERAKAGVKVRLLYDAVGKHKTSGRHLAALRKAGGKSKVFRLVNPLFAKVHVPPRNQRNLLVVDGVAGFAGAARFDDECAGKDAPHGPWRGTHMRLEGPAVVSMQQTFAEDWHFATGERLQDEEGNEVGQSYFVPTPANANHVVQVMPAGPEQGQHSLRDIGFAALVSAQQRLWMAAPYFVPDQGLLQALQLAARRGLDVRLLCAFHPEQWVPLYASQYSWTALLAAGVKVYQYTGGNLQAQYTVIDGQRALVGAGFDFHHAPAHFETGYVLAAADLAQDLQAAFVRDMADAMLLQAEAFAQRPFATRLLERACRLLVPAV